MMMGIGSVLLAFMLPFCSVDAQSVTDYMMDFNIAQYSAQLDVKDQGWDYQEFENLQPDSIHNMEFEYEEVESSFLNEMQQKGITDYVLYDSSELTMEILQSRKGTTVIERCVGFVTDGQTGDGEIINAADKDCNYISYRSVDQEFCDGTVFLSYMVYSPTNNYTDDIVERYDFVISREWED